MEHVFRKFDVNGDGWMFEGVGHVAINNEVSRMTEEADTDDDAISLPEFATLVRSADTDAIKEGLARADGGVRGQPREH